ncbi:MAG: 3'-5' exonuclease, partial [Planctomycetota bacterium]
RVTLLTLHAAKGLEFPHVFIIGLEQGLLPHSRAMEDPAQEEEERRLLFVGITRGMRDLQLSQCKRRRVQGRTRPCIASPFLMELPREEMKIIESDQFMDFDSTTSSMRRRGFGPGKSFDEFEYNRALQDQGDLPTIQIEDETPAGRSLTDPDNSQMSASGYPTDWDIEESDSKADTSDEISQDDPDAIDFPFGNNQSADTANEAAGLFATNDPPTTANANEPTPIMDHPPATRPAAVNLQQSIEAGLLTNGNELSGDGGGGRLLGTENRIARPKGPRLNPASTQEGMIVFHPQHGTGTVIKASGRGPKCVAKIDFEGKQISFRVLFADLTLIS